MKTLIVEDDFVSRLLLQDLLNRYGSIHVAVNGREAVDAVTTALDSGEPYDLICLDIMMPAMDGHEALKEIRRAEEQRGILSTRGTKVIMTTALDNMTDIAEAYMSLCDAYLSKPIDKNKLMGHLQEFRLI